MGAGGQCLGPRAHSTGPLLLPAQRSCSPILEQSSAKGHLHFPLCISVSRRPLLIRTHPTNSLFDFRHMLPNKLTFKTTGVRALTHLSGNTSSNATLFRPSVPRPQCPEVPALHVLLKKPRKGAESLMSLHRVSHFLSSPCLLFLLPSPNHSVPASVHPDHSAEKEGERRKEENRGGEEEEKRREERQEQGRQEEGTTGTRREGTRLIPGGIKDWVYGKPREKCGLGSAFWSLQFVLPWPLPQSHACS